LHQNYDVTFISFGRNWFPTSRQPEWKCITPNKATAGGRLTVRLLLQHNAAIIVGKRITRPCFRLVGKPGEFRLSVSDPGRLSAACISWCSGRP
jgi:hypothetical protein